MADTEAQDLKGGHAPAVKVSSAIRIMRANNNIFVWI
jgi:hypothetical protein